MKEIVTLIIIALVALFVDQTIAKLLDYLEAVGLVVQIAASHHQQPLQPPQHQLWPRIVMESPLPIGIAVASQRHAMSMKEIVTVIVIALEVLFVELTIVRQLAYLEAIGPVVQIAA